MLGQLGDPRLAQRLALMQMAKADATQAPQQNNLPVPRQQELRHPREAQQQPQLRAPGNSFLERVSRGDEMPFDVAGTVKAGGDFIRRGAVSAAPDLKGLGKGAKDLLDKALAIITGSNVPPISPDLARRGFTKDFVGPQMIGWRLGHKWGREADTISPGDLQRVYDTLQKAGVQPENLKGFKFGVDSAQNFGAYKSKQSAKKVVDASKSGISQQAQVEGKGDHLADLFEDLR
tara:strand:- start:9 stop:707 length:699 start_codon:yes stop_codon:yes gene_type:complete